MPTRKEDVRYDVDYKRPADDHPIHLTKLFEDELMPLLPWMLQEMEWFKVTQEVGT